MTDELRERLARIDPTLSDVTTRPVADGASQAQLEKIMNTVIKERVEPSSTRNRTTALAVAAATALVLAIGGVIAFGGGNESPIATGQPLTLDAGQENALAICIAFTAEELARVAEIAFAGTVTSVEGEKVTLQVDEWFRGGQASSVVLNAPLGMEALIGGIPFVVGDQYLISAQDGTVNYCGFSGPSTPEYRAAFEQAFPG